MASSFGMAAEYPSSSLRFGLVDIKPIEVLETIRKFGMRFTKVSRTFESLQPSRSYYDYVVFENQAIFSKIDIPEWFEAEKLVKIYSQRSAKRFDEDIELKKAIEELRSSGSIEGSLLRFTRFFINRFESRRENYLEREAYRFMISNFPLSFYKGFVIQDNTYYDFLKTMEQIVRYFETKARAARNFQMRSRQINAMKKTLSPFIDQMDVCNFITLSLKRFVTVWNASTYDEIQNEPDFLDIKKVDPQRFEQLYNEFTAKMTETRKFLFEKNSRIMEEKLRNVNEPTTNMFGKLVMLPLIY